MARSERSESPTAAAGRHALAVHRDEDWEDFVSSVRYLPILAEEQGAEIAIAWAKTELRSLLALLGLGKPATVEAAQARAAVAGFFDEGPLRLLCASDRAGRRMQTAFIEVVAHEYFEPSVRAVFERSQPSADLGYAPIVGGKS